MDSLKLCLGVFPHDFPGTSQLPDLPGEDSTFLWITQVFCEKGKNCKDKTDAKL